jgi:hypothetical protein
MKTVSDLLRDADPVPKEPARSDRDRSLAREAILRAPAAPAARRKRPLAMATVLALVLIGLVAGSRYWPGAAPDPIAAVRFEIRLAETSPAAGLSEATVAGSSQTVYLHREVIVTNGDIARAEVVPGEQPSTFSVSVVFKPEGARKMLRATTEHLGQRLAILIDGEVVAAPVVKSPISKSAGLSGTFTKPEADRIAAGVIGR